MHHEIESDINPSSHSNVWEMLGKGKRDPHFSRAIGNPEEQQFSIRQHSSTLYQQNPSIATPESIVFPNLCLCQFGYISYNCYCHLLLFPKYILNRNVKFQNNYPKSYFLRLLKCYFRCKAEWNIKNALMNLNIRYL